MDEDQPESEPEEPEDLPWAGIRSLTLLTMSAGAMLLFMGTLIGLSFDPAWRRPPPLISACLAVIVLHEIVGFGLIVWSKGRDHNFW